VNHGQRLVANFLKSCLKFYFEVLLVVVLAASQTLLASATDCGNVAPGAVPPAEPDYLGAELQELDVGSVKSLGFEHALLVVLPVQNGPADRAGLRPGDVIWALNGKLVPSLDEFNGLITRAGSGAEVLVEILRRGNLDALTVRLGGAGETEIIERRIEAYKTIAKVFGKDAFPTLWAMTQNNLGIAYKARVQGNRLENLEAAIKAYEAALTVFTREASPQDWARTQGYLTLALAARLPHEALPQAPVEPAAVKSEAQTSEEKPLPAEASNPASPAPTEPTSKSEAQTSEEKLFPAEASSPASSAPTEPTAKSEAQEYSSQKRSLSPAIYWPRRAVRLQHKPWRRVRHGRLSPAIYWPKRAVRVQHKPWRRARHSQLIGWVRLRLR
jgi:membrane-associated protease RseP (regulator of RpoE activity)